MTPEEKAKEVERIKRELKIRQIKETIAPKVEANKPLLQKGFENAVDYGKDTAKKAAQFGAAYLTEEPFNRAIDIVLGKETMPGKIATGLQKFSTYTSPVKMILKKTGLADEAIEIMDKKGLLPKNVEELKQFVKDVSLAPLQGVTAKEGLLASGIMGALGGTKWGKNTGEAVQNIIEKSRLSPDTLEALGLGSGLIGARVKYPKRSKGLEVDLKKGAQTTPGTAGGELIESAEKEIARIKKDIYEPAKEAVKNIDLKNKKIKKTKMSLTDKEKIQEVKAKGGKIDENGYVEVYHFSTGENIKNILKSGKMVGKEDGLFFSSNPSGIAKSFGDKFIKLKIPISKIDIDDIFDNEVHFRLKSEPNVPINIKKFISSNLTEETVEKIKNNIIKNTIGLNKTEQNSLLNIIDDANINMSGNPMSELLEAKTKINRAIKNAYKDNTSFADIQARNIVKTIDDAIYENIKNPVLKKRWKDANESYHIMKTEMESIKNALKTDPTGGLEKIFKSVVNAGTGKIRSLKGLAGADAVKNAGWVDLAENAFSKNKFDSAKFQSAVKKYGRDRGPEIFGDDWTLIKQLDNAIDVAEGRFEAIEGIPFTNKAGITEMFNKINKRDIQTLVKKGIPTGKAWTPAPVLVGTALASEEKGE